MQRRSIILRIFAIGCLAIPLFIAPTVSYARQGTPAMAGMAAAAQQKQSDAMKNNFGFTDAQVKRYFAKESKLNAQTQKELAELRKKLTGTKDKDMRRKIVIQMRDTNTTLNKKYRDALLSIATPVQRPKILASL